MISRKNPKNRKFPLYLILPLILPSILISLIKQYWNRCNLSHSSNNTETGTTYLSHQTILKQVQLISLIKQYWNNTETGTTYLTHQTILKQVQLIPLIKQYWNRYNLSHSLNNIETGTTAVDLQNLKVEVEE